MAARPLSDEQANAVMKKMCAFIEQEALEKAKEIKVKADEDYTVEKAKIVRRETAAIDDIRNKRAAKEEVKRKILATNYSNEAKLKVLRKQDELLNEIFNSARLELSQLARKDQTLHRAMLEDLVVQGCYELLEPNVTVQCCKSDATTVAAVLSSVKERVRRETGIMCETSLDLLSELPESEIGGVLVTSMGGKIKVLNTLACRLEVASEKLLPELRVLLYGAPPNRRFFD